MNSIQFLTFKNKVLQCYQSLSPKEQKIADYMLKEPEKITEYSAIQIAEEAGGSAATVIRFCKSVGFAGLADLKMNIRKEQHAFERSGMPEYNLSESSVSTVKHGLLGYHMQVVQSILNNWNEAAYRHAVDEICQAGQIVISSYGGSKAAAIALLDLFNLLGLPCDANEDMAFATMRIGRLKPGDVAIGITFSGRYAETIRQLTLAKSRGATTIGITGFLDSKLAECSDILLNTNLPGEEYAMSTLSARISEMAVVEILYLLLATRLGNKIESRGHNNELLEFDRIPWENV